MKSICKIALIASLFVVSFPTIEAQKMLEEAHIEYEVTDIKSESMEAQMMKGTLINVYFNQKNTKMNVQMMGGMVTMDILTETATESTTMLMNMMGRKVQVEQPKEEEKAENEEGKPNFDITYDKSDTKDIAGYECTKATLTDKETNESFIMYVAKKFKAKTEMVEKMFPGLEGIPMEISIDAQGMGATITALNVKKSVDASAFDVPEGYEKMTPEQFQKEMGGMGNFGF